VEPVSDMYLILKTIRWTKRHQHCWWF